ncbi:site-specific DNA-methyltransferase [Pseudarthrobacter sp. BIM B-2242]|uniref:site-specific DNA-methyltransferase n=1 Tax=Pseudarthrobacter sp. BIM B-2242 TaxID=2772401 RepID=UPI001CC5010A|nr:site-specific DNA-methyltransferase [Pseudarthrobacter sp. BIM B-2242]
MSLNIAEAAGAGHLPAAVTVTPPRAETTSSLERYLAEISDPILRENLSREIGSLKREFGLVFERHHPEGIRLPKHTVKRGSKVVVSTVNGKPNKDSEFYRVHRLNRDESTALLVDAEGNEAIHPIANLTVAKEFGDVMYPGLRKLSEIRRGAPEAPVHTIINGENYHALEALQYTHTGKVDLIYIDPPYNTGNADWKYNDRYVDAKDGYRHSKWLSFMEKRLAIAKTLLKPTGVLIMAIGDDEHHRLRLLADDVLGEGNFISNIVWQGGRKNDSRFISNGADYMLVYARNRELLVERDVRWREAKQGLDLVLNEAERLWEEAGHNAAEASVKFKRWLRALPREVAMPGVTRYDQLEEGTGRPFNADKDMGWPGGGGPRFDVLHPITQKPVSVPTGGWRFTTPARMQEEIDAGRVQFGPDERKIPRGKSYLDEIDSQVAMSVFDADRTAASKALFNILGDKRFPFPKDQLVLSRWFRLMAPTDAVILDFFGGSGTTAEAVIRLNAEDSGSRQAILVTNNELSKADDTKLRKAGHQPGDDEYEALGVFHHVTKPRLETVVTGVREDGSKYSDGLDANIAFFELTYLDEPEIVTGRAFNDLAGLFWLKAGGIGGTVELTAGAKADGFAISASGRTAVLFTPGRAQALAGKLAATEHAISHLFIVTDSEAQGDEAATHFPGGITVERIYGNYLEAFQVNRKD